ncbi:MAG: hypothetical protein NT075_24885 [Chloroflexi bacterium]|nr:hypothetical protein [Chloroflexota bacterium]
MQKIFWRGFLILCLLVVAALSIRQANYAYASRLLATSTILKNSHYLLNKDEEIHYFTTTAYRVTPLLKELPDPYHRMIVPFLTTERINETWVTSDTVHSITRLNDPAQTIIGEFIKRGDTILMYDAVTGNASKNSSEPQAIAANAPSNLDQLSWISGMKQSNWQRTAWVVKFSPVAMNQENFPTFSGNPAANTPMADDLQFKATQWIWEIDQETGLLVSSQWLALTDNEPTVLFSEVYSLPEVIATSTKPKQLDEFMLPDAVDLLGKIDQTTSLSAEEAAPLMFGTTATSEQIASEAGFSLYAPTEAVLQRFEPKISKTRIYYNPTRQCHLDRTLAFDFELCAGLGQTVKLEYLFSNLATYEDIKSVFVSQGPASEVIPMLQKSLPDWQASEPFTLNIGEKQVQGWTLSINNGDQKSIALLFNLNGTMVQVSGYKATIDELKAVAENLTPIPHANSSRDGRIFIPFVQR